MNRGVREVGQSAVPDSLRFPKPKTIVDGIRQEQYVCINQNTIPANPSTPYGSEIQFWIAQLPNTFWDPETAYFVFHAVATFQSISNAFTSPALAIGANDSNGAIIGGFYSCFQRYAVWANGLNQTDDINEIGIVAIRILNISMTKQAREAMAFMFGFQMDPFSSASLAGYRIKGCFPYSADSDSAVIQNPASTGITGLGEQGLTVSPLYYFNQNFDFAIPVIGTLGMNNPNLYYMGLGNTKVSLFTDQPNNFMLLPPGMFETRYFAVNNTASSAFPTTPNTQLNTLAAGGLANSVWAITRARLIANTIILSQSVMELVMSAVGSQIVSLCQSFTQSSQSLQVGLSGIQQLTFSNRRGSMNYVIVLFNNTGTSTATSFINSTGGSGWNNTATGGQTTSIVEIPNFFNKYGSINPGLTMGTNLSINNTLYPKNGALNPTQFPSETLAFMAENMNMYSNSDQKWAPPSQNWMVADPIVVQQGLGGAANFPSTTITNSTQQTQFWRSGTVTNGINQITVGGTANCTTCPFFKWCFVALETVSQASAWWGSEKYVMSNDFFLFFGLQDQSRKGMVSGKNTMDGSNFLNANLLFPTSYAYNVYFIANFDMLIVHDFVSRNVYAIS